MDRKEFSSLLVQQREAKNIGKNEMCRLTGFTFLQLQRIENAGNNYNMGLVFRYLSAAKLSMVLQKGNKEWVFVEYSKIPKWLSNTRDGKFSLRKLALAVGCTYSAVTNVEHEKTVISVDLFLKIVDIFECDIRIKLLPING